MKVILTIKTGTGMTGETRIEVDGVPHVVEEIIKSVKVIIAEKFPYSEIK